MTSPHYLFPHNLRELEDICDTVGLIHNGKLLFTRDLDTMKCNINKIQCVISDHSKEEELLSELSILQYEKSGSLLTITARGSRDEILRHTMDKEPVFAEILPLSLKEIFISERRWQDMTSKTSCNNSTSYKNRIPYRRYILENIKQRSWLAATSLIAFFLLQPVYIMVNIENFLKHFRGRIDITLIKMLFRIC